MNDSATAISHAIVARDVTVTRGATQILRGVNCEIERGTCTAILGKNGCGKTSFTRAITGHMFLTDGTVTVLGEPIGRTDIRALRRRISVVHPSTDTASMHISGAVVDGELSAHDAVLTGFFGTVGLYDKASDYQHARADQLLDDVGLGDRCKLRFGLLSTGEQRRCLIARALAVPPELLILDEPTAGLDISGREHVLATVEQILAQPNPPTVLMITHHVEELSPRTSKVFLMRDGQFIAQGKPNDVITPEALTETFGCKVYVKQRNGRFWLEVLPEAWLDLIKRDDSQG